MKCQCRTLARLWLGVQPFLYRVVVYEDQPGGVGDVRTCTTYARYKDPTRWSESARRGLTLGKR